MLEQYQKDFPQSSNTEDALSDSRFQMSRRRLVFTLAGASLLLLCFLFLVTFKGEESVAEKPEPTYGAALATIEAKLQEHDARLTKLEKQPIAAIQPAPSEIVFPEEAIVPVIESSYVPPVQTAAVADTAPPVKTEQAAPSRTYVVQRGDSLSKISTRFYGTTKYWKEIYTANKERIGNSNQLKVGTELTIPDEKTFIEKK
ncbi:MAG: LysM peptidoglycan-binding domain-containing protein [Verrucomicrobia bacterium]|nr:LysM peptidoglycan-binding domain-containing protein [Verrucomicrobiota bacterium]